MKKIIYYRKKKMMSQEELAEALHVSRQTLLSGNQVYLYQVLNI